MYELQRIYRKSSKGNRKPHWEATILFHKVTKNNGVTKDCFLIRENDYDVSPSVYLEDYYHAFRDGATIPELAEKKFSISIRSAETIHRWMQDIFWNLII